MNTVHIRNIALGEGIPKICVPIVARTCEAILEEAKRIRALSADLVEWRADWFEDVFTPGTVSYTHLDVYKRQAS